MTDWYMNPNAEPPGTGETPYPLLMGYDGVTSGTTLTSATGGFTEGMVGYGIIIAGSRRTITGYTNANTISYNSSLTAGSNKAFCVAGPAYQITTFMSGYTVGDRFKLPKSEPPSAAGNMTYTLDSDAVSFASGRIAIIDDFLSGWTPAANVTASTHATYKDLTRGDVNPYRFVVAAAFATGKIAYKDLGAGNELDLSAFQGISLPLLITNANLAAGALQLHLCSDDAGDTPVDVIELTPYALNASALGVFARGLRTGGGNLGSAIRSVALYASVDPGAVYIHVANLVAIKAEGNADHLCHGCILSQGDDGLEDVWWGITRFETNTSLKLGGKFTAGTAGEQATCKRHPMWWQREFVIPVLNGGTYTTRWTISGGWDFDTGLQDGETCFAVWGVAGAISPISPIGDGFLLERLVANGKLCDIHSGISNAFTIQDCGLVGNAAASRTAIPIGTSSNTTAFYSVSDWEIKRLWATGYPAHVLSTPSATVGGSYKQTNHNWRWEDIRIYGCRGMSIGSAARWRIRNMEILNCQGTSQQELYITDGAWDWDVYGLKLSGGLYGIQVMHFANNIRIWNLEASGHGTATFYMPNADIRLFNPVITDGTVIGYSNKVSRLTVIKGGGVADTHEITTTYGTISSDAVTRHTAGGISWKLSPTTAYLNPLRMKLATLAVEAGVPTTVGAWMRRTDTGIEGRLIIPGGQLAGVPADLKSSIAVGADMWTLRTVSFTPTETGVLEVYVEAQGGTEYSVYVDDFSVVV